MSSEVLWEEHKEGLGSRGTAYVIRAGGDGAGRQKVGRVGKIRREGRKWLDEERQEQLCVTEGAGDHFELVGYCKD